MLDDKGLMFDLVNVSVVTLYEHLGKDNSARVILWGNGYGAALATFARKKFPHLIDGVKFLIDFCLATQEL